MAEFTVAICSYNRSQNLPSLIAALRKQQTSVRFDILVVDNNSTDDTQLVLADLAKQDGVPLRFVCEAKQGIPYARNRAIEEAISSVYMAFLDDDEIPMPGFIDAAYSSLENDSADCVGGPVTVIFPSPGRPRWLGNDLLGFLAAVDYGKDAFWIKDHTTPIWTCNVAYRMALFRDDPELLFDFRYNRKGKSVGGGEDVVMFRELMKRNIKIRYVPSMSVDHYVEGWRLNRKYFLRLHYSAGKRKGLHESIAYDKSMFGVPPFMLRQVFEHFWKVFTMWQRGEAGVLRQAMNGTHAIGYAVGCFLKWKN